MKVGIIGHGFVGQAMDRLFAPRFEVGVYDVQTQPHIDPIVDADFILICVPTPMADDGSCDTTYVRAAAKTAHEYTPKALVCFKSAVPPGTTDLCNEIYPGDKFCVSPEYLGEGTRPVPPWEYPDPTDARFHDFVIVGGPRASDALNWFQAVMPTTARYVACTALEAEACKRMENAWLATKVTFVNEMYDIAQALGVDWHKLRELWLLDPRVGRSHTAVFPDARGYGGKCLPKDLSALISEAERAGVDAGLLKSVRETNAKWRQR